MNKQYDIFNTDKVFDIAIIGGGAAGMAAAVAARRENPEASIVIFDKNERLGTKLYATGNGRCNLTNRGAYGCWEVLSFFEDLGLACDYDEEGRYYPASQMAEDVVFAMESYISRNGIGVLLGTPCEDITVSEMPPEDGLYLIRSGECTYKAAKVLLAAGGKAGPQFGTTGDGYGMARRLGHTVGPVYPALSGIESAVPGLKGVRARAAVSLLRRGETVYRESGQVQFTDYGLSGIVIMNASNLVRFTDGLAAEDYELVLDLAQSRTVAELRNILSVRMEKGLDPLRGFVPRKLCDYMHEMYAAQGRNGFSGAKQDDSPETGNGDLAVLRNGNSSALRNAVDDNKVYDYITLLKQLRFPVTGVRGWKTAQCTGGGVALSQINTSTMESRLHKGLYFAGEMLDETGPCGGFNLTQAFFTGIKAGRAMGAGR